MTVEQKKIDENCKIISSRVGLSVIMIFLLTELLSSCQHERKFNRSEWCEMSSVNDYTRDDMLKDVLSHHITKGKSIQEIKYLLCGEGTVDYLSASEPGMVINIVTKYNGIDPDYTKDLYVYINLDSTIRKIEIHENQR
jgi:hypothetical protein